VLQISRCRSKDFISLVDVRVTFDFTRMGLSADSEGCHSDNYTEYYGDCNSDNGSAHSNSDDDDNDNVADNDNDNDNDNVDDEDNDNDNVDDIIDGEEGNREHHTLLYDIEESSNNAPIRSIPTAAFTVDNIKKPITAADYRYLHYPTLRIRTVKRALSLCGHQIVGDGGAVKSAKGLFACIVSVTISGMSSDPRSPLLPSEGEKEDVEKEEEDVHLERLHGLSVSTPTASRTSRTSRTFKTFSVDDPKKFSKLMIKEQELWESAQRRDSEVMTAWQALSLQPSANVVEDFDIEFLPLQESFQKDSYGGSVIDETNTKFKGNESDSRVESPMHSSSNSNSNVATRFKSFEDMKDAMASGMPVEYVLGEATFCGFKFCVNNAVMVPRNSSEVLVLEAVKVILNDMILEGGDGCENKYKNLRKNENENGNDRIAFVTEPEIRQKRVRVLDIGTGSGCLLLSCLNKLEDVLNDRLKENTDAKNKDKRTNIEVDSNFIIEGVGIDLSESALQVAHTNAITLNLQDSTVFKIQDFAHLEDLVPVINMTHTSHSSPLTGPCSFNGSGGDITVTSVESRVQDPLFCTTEKWLGPYDVVLCNPPYSSKRDTTRLSVACREHEPSLALFSPDGPLSAYRTLAASLTACEAKRMHVIAVESSGIPLGPGTETETGIPLGPGTGIPLGPGTGIPLGHGAGPGIFNINAHLFLEVGHGQALPVQKIFNKLQFMTFIGVARDHKDIDRCLMYRYNGL
jgi:methylase of polypeptide subunit release factors